MNDTIIDGTLAFWSLKIEEGFKQVNSRSEGLLTTEIKDRKNKYGSNSFKSDQKQTSLFLFLNQFKNPITIILLLASILSYVLQDKTNAIIIIAIVFISSG